MKNSETFIQLKNVSKTYNGSVSKFTALNNINLDLEKGSFNIIQGASGSGKSTLLNILSGIDKPSQGEVWINSVPVHNLSSNKLARWRGTNVGIVFQFFQLMPTLSVIENVMLPMEFVGKIPFSEQKQQAIKLLEKANVAHLATKFPHTLSGGEKQRVAIARALANNPEIIIADEPTGNLDSKNSELVHSIFNDLNKEGKTILYVTHEQNLPAGYTNKIVIADGEILIPKQELEKSTY